jgi:hypothetical protein
VSDCRQARFLKPKVIKYHVYFYILTFFYLIVLMIFTSYFNAIFTSTFLFVNKIKKEKRKQKFLLSKHKFNILNK